MIQEIISVVMLTALAIIILGMTALVPMIVIAAYRDLKKDKLNERL